MDTNSAQSSSSDVGDPTSGALVIEPRQSGRCGARDAAAASDTAGAVVRDSTRSPRSCPGVDAVLPLYVTKLQTLGLGGNGLAGDVLSDRHVVVRLRAAALGAGSGPRPFTGLSAGQPSATRQRRQRDAFSWGLSASRSAIAERRACIGASFSAVMAAPIVRTWDCLAYT